MTEAQEPSGAKVIPESKSMAPVQEVKSDPYALDFKTLRGDYMAQTSKKLRYSKASFLHYCKNPYVYAEKYGGNDTMLSMELVSAPNGCIYKRIVGKDELKKIEAETMKKYREEAAAKEKEEKAKLKALEQAAAREQRRATLRAEREAAGEDFEEGEQYGINADVPAEDEELAQSAEGEGDQEQEYGGEDEDDYVQDYGDYGDEEGGEEEEEQAEGEDRIYNGDMFNEKRSRVKKVPLALADRQMHGELRAKTETLDHVLISVWRIGGRELHFSRLADVFIPYPPVTTDERFYTSHTGDAIYYLSKHHGHNCIIVVNLYDFTWQMFDLAKPGVPKFESLDNSCLIFNNHVLIFQDFAHKKENHLSGDYWGYDLHNQERIWHGINIEKIFFAGDRNHVFPEEDSDKGGKLLLVNQFDKEIKEHRPESFAEKKKQRIINPPKKIVVLTLSVEETPKSEAELKKEAEEKAADPAKPAAQPGAPGFQENLLMYHFYKIERFSDNFMKGATLIWEHSETTTMPISHQLSAAELDKEAADAEKEEKKEIAAAEVIEKAVSKVGGIFSALKKNITDGLAEAGKAMGIEVKIAAEDQIILPEDAEEAQKKKVEEKPTVLYANDCTLNEMTMIVIGTQGNQHHVLQFAGDDHKAPRKKNQKPGNCTISISQNSYLRSANAETFILLTTSKGETSAKPLTPAEHAEDKLPTIILHNADVNFAKDCWLEQGHNDEIEAIQTIAKSSTDEYLNVSSIDLSHYDPSDPHALKKLKMKNAKMKGQELMMAYPCVASNVGCRLINIQSIAQPDIHCQLTLPSDFLCFTNYNKLQDIGFLDKRPKQVQQFIPFEETGEYIAFLTRTHGHCDSEDCKKGDILLNILHCESFAEPMVFTHWVTEYEACMDEGSRDDVMFKSYCVQVQSSRGVDVTLVNQYNDSIVFDCITSTRQKPIKFPYKVKEGEEAEFEDLKICQDCHTVPVPMVMDNEGEIHFMTQDKTNLVKVYRVNNDAEMGEDAFFQVVYTLQSKWVYFFLYNNEQEVFYLMDESKRVRVLKPDPKTKKFNLTQQFEIPKAEKEQLDQTPFDEFACSAGVLHWNDKVIPLLQNKSFDNATWASFDIMQKNYEQVQGPKHAYGSGLVYYIEKYKDIDEEVVDGKAPKKKNFFGSNIIVLQPKGDLSFVECLPIHKTNHNNFFSYIGPDRIMASYGGRFLIFDKLGNFQGNVEFNVPKWVNSKRLRLHHFCEKKDYFVFEGPEMKEPEKKDDNKAAAAKGAAGPSAKTPRGTAAPALKQPPAPPARRFYVFYLKREQWGWWAKSSAKVEKFVFHAREMPIKPVEAKDRAHTFFNILPSGLFEQTTVYAGEDFDRDEKKWKKLNVTLRQSMSYEEAKKGESADYGTIKETKFVFDFQADNYYAQKARNDELLKPLSKAKKNWTKLYKDEKPFPFEDQYARLARRNAEMIKAWKFGEFVIVKCGSAIQYARVSQPDTPRNFNVDFGQDIWLNSMYQTGVDCLLQFYLIDDVHHVIYLITWNMELNREHSLFQTRYKEGQFPENLILSCYGSAEKMNFNFCLEDGCIIDLDNNVPIQFFDKETEGDLIPHGALKATVAGQKKISEDRQAYLDLLHPGRVQLFVSTLDLIYWERYQTDKTNHEIFRGKVSSFGPISRFPKGISVFHYYATNQQFLTTFANAYELEKTAKKDDKRIQLFPLIFLHKHPIPNKQGHRVTPLQVALEKQSPSSFEAMLQLLTEMTDVCISCNLLGKLQDLIDNPSPAVMDLMNKSFRTTDQLEGPRPLKWPGDAEELFIDVPTAYLTDNTLQALVNEAFDVQEEEEQKEEEKEEPKSKYEFVDGFVKYDRETCEYLAVIDEDEDNTKQVEAKLLDFDWVFIKDNSKTVIKCLAETGNDEIFSCTQIRVLTEFMWQHYQPAIQSTLFYPYCIYFVAFVLYASKFASFEGGNLLTWGFFLNMASLVLFGKNWITFALLELIQLKDDPLGYFTNMWNLIDLSSLVTCGLFVFFDFSGTISRESNNILGAFAVLLLYIKLFYWLRIYKSFSAFIRMISEIVMDIKVFSVMLFLCLAGFANIMMVVNNNRTLTGTDSIFTDFVGNGPANAIIHAYLTGLGDFQRDNYVLYNDDGSIAGGNYITTMIFFLGATFLVQLVFMNMLIAMMGESFGRISGILEQSTLKECCVMMNDHVWLLDFGEQFKKKRYILWLTPGGEQAAGSAVERQLTQLRAYVEERALQSDQATQRMINALDEQISEIKALVGEAEEGQDDEEYQETETEIMMRQLQNLSSKMERLCEKMNVDQ